MAAKQIHELVSDVRSIHSSLEEKVRQARQKGGEKEELSRILQFLEQSEEHIDKTLAGYNDQTRTAILNTYIRYYPEEIVKAMYHLMDKAATHTGNELVSAIHSIKEDIVRMLDACNNSLLIPDVREFLEDIKTHEYCQLKEMGRRLVEMEQGV